MVVPFLNNFILFNKKCLIFKCCTNQVINYGLNLIRLYNKYQRLQFSIKMRKIEQDERSYYSNNRLNIAFIAQDSKDIQSISCKSDIESISSISRLASQSIPGSPQFSFQPEISNMEEWSNDGPPNIFGKQSPNFPDFRKRPTRNSIPESIEQNNEDQQQIQKLNKCTKKRVGSKNKIITITPSFKQYGLRSKAKANNGNSFGNLSSVPPVVPVAPVQNQYNENQSGSNSSDELRQMVSEIGSKKTRASRKMLE